MRFHSDSGVPGLDISFQLYRLLFAFNYLRNSDVSPRESFPIGQINGLKLSPIRCTFVQFSQSVIVSLVKLKYVNIVFPFEMLFFDIVKALLRFTLSEIYFNKFVIFSKSIFHGGIL